jgi:hypothetical protein
MNSKDLVEMGQGLFTKRSSLLLLWQEIAENFYPERADFTYQRYLGMDFGAHLMTSYPVLCRRDLGDQLGTMLRPTAKEWAHVVPVDTRLEDNDTKRWLEWASGLMRRAMYDPDSLFTKATKQADHDFATFGQAVMSVRLNRNNDTLLYNTWHLRDVAWFENADGKIGGVFRKWKPGARDLKRLFGAKVHQQIDQMLQQNKPLEEVECVHMIVDAELFDGAAKGRPYWSIYYDVTHQHEMEAVPVWNPEYAIPRWFTVSGSQYANSPAVVAALPEARLIQAMTYTLLEAGEKVVNPPMIATQDVVRSDVAVFAGGMTWVDRDYDERLGEALRPMNIDAKGMPLGVEMQKDSRGMIAQAFFLNKLAMPNRGPEMTAYEVGQRIQEYIRGALPIFEPMEMEYNGRICKLTFDLLRRAGAFGHDDLMPKKLRGTALQFRFESPLHDAIEQQKGQKFLEMKQLVAEAIAMDQNVAAIPDVMTALRDALEGVQVPAEWMRSKTTVEQMRQAADAARKSAELLDAMQKGADVGATIAGARKDSAAAEAASGAPAVPA